MFLLQALNLVTIVVWVGLSIAVIWTLIQIGRRDGLGSAAREIVRPRNLGILLLALVLTVVARSLVFVEPQQVGVVVSLINPNGYRDRPIRSGLHWLPPLMEQVYIYPISWQTYTMSHTPVEGERNGNDAITARSADGQEVVIDSSIIYQVIPEQAVRIHIEWQSRYQEDFVRAVSRGVVRSVASNYTAEEINSDKRQDLELQINGILREAFRDKGFNLDRFVLRNIAFSPEFALAIEEKQVAQEGVTRNQYQADQVRQLAEGRGDEVRIKAEAEAEAIRLRAEAEAEALHLLASALAENPDLLSYRYIDKLAPNIRVMLVPNNAPFILPLNNLNLDEEQVGPIDPSPTPDPSPSPEPTPTPQP